MTPSRRTLFANEFVTFSCMSKGGPSNIIQWGISGVDLPGENGTSLNVTRVDAADGGTYTCTVRNRAGVDQDTAVLFSECLWTHCIPRSLLFVYGLNDIYMQFMCPNVPQPGGLVNRHTVDAFPSNSRPLLMVQTWLPHTSCIFKSYICACQSF